MYQVSLHTILQYKWYYLTLVTSFDTLRGDCSKYRSLLVCFKDPNDVDRGSCSGDSGGPFTVNGTLIGLVSWGAGMISFYHSNTCQIYSSWSWRTQFSSIQRALVPIQGTFGKFFSWRGSFSLAFEIAPKVLLWISRKLFCKKSKVDWINFGTILAWGQADVHLQGILQSWHSSRISSRGFRRQWTTTEI